MMKHYCLQSILSGRKEDWKHFCVGKSADSGDLKWAEHNQEFDKSTLRIQWALNWSISRDSWATWILIGTYFRDIFTTLIDVKWRWMLLLFASAFVLRFGKQEGRERKTTDFQLERLRDHVLSHRSGPRRLKLPDSCQPHSMCYEPRLGLLLISFCRWNASYYWIRTPVTKEKPRKQEKESLQLHHNRMLPCRGDCLPSSDLCAPASILYGRYCFRENGKTKKACRNNHIQVNI